MAWQGKGAPHSPPLQRALTCLLGRYSGEQGPGSPPGRHTAPTKDQRRHRPSPDTWTHGRRLSWSPRPLLPKRSPAARRLPRQVLMRRPAPSNPAPPRTLLECGVKGSSGWWTRWMAGLTRHEGSGGGTQGAGRGSLWLQGGGRCGSWASLGRAVPPMLTRGIFWPRRAGHPDGRRAAKVTRPRLNMEAAQKGVAAHPSAGGGAGRGVRGEGGAAVRGPRTHEHTLPYRLGGRGTRG